MYIYIRTYIHMCMYAYIYICIECSHSGFKIRPLNYRSWKPRECVANGSSWSYKGTEQLADRIIKVPRPQKYVKEGPKTSDSSPKGN